MCKVTLYYPRFTAEEAEAPSWPSLLRPQSQSVAESGSHAGFWPQSVFLFFIYYTILPASSGGERRGKMKSAGLLLFWNKSKVVSVYGEWKDKHNPLAFLEWKRRASLCDHEEKGKKKGDCSQQDERLLSFKDSQPEIGSQPAGVWLPYSDSASLDHSVLWDGH